MPSTLIRPALLAVLGLLLMSGALMAARGPTKEAGSEAPPAPPKVSRATPAPAPAAPSAQKPEAGPRPSQSRVPDAAPSERRLPRKARSDDIRAGVARALQAHQVVVLFFSQRGAADDAATHRAVKAINSHVDRKRVKVFSDQIAHVGRYSAMLADIGVSRAPSVVVVDRAGSAEVLEGFIDDKSLLEHVKSAGG